MAKGKIQKQEEALARKRANFVKFAIPSWIRCQPGGVLYDHELATYGKEAARRMASDAESYLIKMAKEAKVDRHGNPINPFDVYRKVPDSL